MNDRIDDLLREALTPSKKPDARLNQRILDKARERNNMKKPFYKTLPIVAALSIAVLATGSLTAYGAWKYLGTEQVAKEFGDKKLADVFKGNDAISINESQIYGGYRITLMGTVSGNNISEHLIEANGELRTDRTYSVIAIEKEDGSPMPDTSDEDYDNNFLVSPFIKGEDPAFLNIYHMDGGCSAFVEDGIEYRLVDHDNIEAFADRGVYIGVLDNVFYDREAYNFDKKTGQITRNENYNGVNALFTLPLDKSKADEEKAQKLLDNWYADDEDTENADDTDKEASEWNTLKKDVKLIKGTVKKYPASEFHNLITHNPDVKWNGNAVGYTQIRPDSIFKENEYGTYVVGIFGFGDEKDAVYTVMHRSKKDGTITISSYHK